MRNDKARRYLTSMRKKQPVLFSQKFPNADPFALRLLERLLAFDPKDRPSAEEVLYSFVSNRLFRSLGVSFCRINLHGTLFHLLHKSFFTRIDFGYLGLFDILILV